MKKLSLLLMLFLFATNISAQDISESATQKIDSLQTQLNKLQHDYDYLYYNNEFNNLKYDLKTLRNEILASSALTSIYVLIGEYDKETYIKLKENFDSFNERYIIENEMVSLWKTILPYKLSMSNFSEEEKKLIENSLKVVEECYYNIKGALEHQEFLIDKYKDLKWR